MKKHGHWTITASNLQYRNPWIELTEDKVVGPSGKRGVFGTLTVKSGVSVLALDEKGFVYLTREFHYAVGKVTIETAVGGIEKGEKPLEAAKRELKEELGITATKWNDLGYVQPLTTLVRCPMHLFLARKLSFGKAHNDADEIIKPLKVKFEKAVKMAMQGEIFAAAPVANILKAKLFLAGLAKA